ncbi:hypothetical protein [uncultured Jatrophihabitans sp.]|uniref:hypothetical protein n=1 Tax=uncultured Jatrophihabitans sp. TaxID=1610747 RepID=UPI0035CC5C92
MDAERAVQLRSMTAQQIIALPYRYADPDEEELVLGLKTAIDVAANRARAAKFEQRLSSLSPVLRKRRVDVFIRCPLNCLLVEVFLQRPATEGQRVFLTAYTTKGRKTFYANGGTTDDGMDPDMWAPISCRHGAGQFVLYSAIDLVLFAGLPRGANRRITDEVVMTSPSPNGPVTSTQPLLVGPYAKWTPK